MLTSADGTHASSIRPDRATPPGAARQRHPFEPAGSQRHPVRRRAWLQMARVTDAVRQLAHHLHSDESVVEERSARPGLRAPAARTDCAHQARGGVDGQHYCQGASGRDGGAKKNGAQSIGRSRGGWTTKIHMVAADARTAITFSLSPGQAHDAPEGRKLLNRLGQQHNRVSLIMDRAYEGNETRQLALELGYEPVVPPLRTRVDPWEYNREMYKRRNEIERLFRRLKGFAESSLASRNSTLCSSDSSSSRSSSMGCGSVNNALGRQAPHRHHGQRGRQAGPPRRHDPRNAAHDGLRVPAGAHSALHAAVPPEASRADRDGRHEPAAQPRGRDEACLVPAVGEPEHDVSGDRRSIRSSRAASCRSASSSPTCRPTASTAPSRTRTSAIRTSRGCWGTSTGGGRERRSTD